MEDLVSADEYDKLLVATTTCLIIAIVAGVVTFVTTYILVLVTCRKKTFHRLPRIV